MVGYSGGKEAAPTYRSMGGHTEAVLVAFDPGEVELKTLIDLFWRSHNPGVGTSWAQYRNVVFYHDSAQLKVIETTRDEVAKNLGAPVATAIEEASAFYPAEDYHQKYILRRKKEVYLALRKLYPEEADFVAATLSARLNGYFDGAASMDDVEKELRDGAIPVQIANEILHNLI